MQSQAYCSKLTDFKIFFYLCHAQATVSAAFTLERLLAFLNALLLCPLSRIAHCRFLSLFCTVLSATYMGYRILFYHYIFYFTVYMLVFLILFFVILSSAMFIFEL